MYDNFILIKTTITNLDLIKLIVVNQMQLNCAHRNFDIVNLTC